VTAAAAPSPATAAVQDEGDPHRYLIALAATLASLIQVIDTSIVNVAIPHMMGELGASIDEIAWVSTGYILASVIVIPMTSWLSGYFGRKRYFTTSIIIFTIASFFCGASTTLPTLIFWRIVQGIGGGALLSTSQAVIFEAFPRREVGTAMALFGLGVMVGPTIGPTLGGWLTDNYSWPWIFYINLPIGAAAALMAVAYVHDSAHQVKSAKIDFPGIAILAVSVSALQYFVEHGQRDDWFNSPLMAGLAIGGVIGVVLLVWRELVVEHPVINFRVLRHRDVWIGVVIGVVFGVALFGSVFILPIFLQSNLRMSAWQTGMVILPGAVMTAVSMVIAGRLSNRVDARVMIAIGVTLFAVAMWQLGQITPLSGPHDFFWPLVWRGLGLGLMFVPLTNITLADLAPREVQDGASISIFFRQLGGSFGIAGMAALLTRFTVQARDALGAHLSAGDPMVLQRVSAMTRAFMTKGIDSDAAQRMALTVLDRQLLGQASAIAFAKVYLLSGLILVLTLPLLLLVRHTRPGAPGAVVAE
jgi:MFS transporter, DHA2 family, multidrug resistance protein